MLAVVLLIPAGLLAAAIGVCLVLNFRTPAATQLASSAQLANPPAALREPVTLKIVTFNIWGLYGISSDRARRMPAIGERLAQLEPDIIGFQEAFIQQDRETVLKGLAQAGLTHHRYFRSGLVGSGLLVVSRYPIAEAHFRRYSRGGKPHRLQHGDWWAGKGVCLVRVELPGAAGYVDLFNTHAHANYGNADYDPVRLSNMTEMAAYIREAATGTSPAFAVGDFNCRAGTPQYDAVINGAGLERLMTIETRIDHVFGVANPRYVFEVLETVPVEKGIDQGGGEFRLSDHTGYMSTIRVTPKAL